MKIRVKNIPLIVLIVWIYPNLYGQYTSNYQNNWHFGIGSGMNFSTISPTSIASSINGYEVTTCQSDGFGNTIFYAGANAATTSGSGFTVWDASNNTMPNGNVNMDYSSSCGLITAPVPGNCDQYYIFHLASTATGWGLFYSVVDMTLPGNGTVPLPLGDIVAGQKNILVYSADNLAEKIEIVQKGSTENYWVITRSITNDNFYCFEVSSTGVNSVPVTSAVTAATYPTAPFPSPIAGWLAASPDRSMLAEVNGVCDPTNVTLYSFDHQTGVVSFGEQLWSGVFGVDLPYGIEFSPNSSVLYFERFNSTSGNSFIHNYDLTAGMGNISLTQQDFIFAAGTNYGAMVRAKDGKIYKAQIATSTGLTVINSPNNYITPNIVFNQYSLAPTSTLIGLPNLSYYFHPDNYSDTLAGNDRTICSGNQVEIGAIGYDSVWVDYVWEPASMIQGTINQATPMTVNLTADQQYIVHLITACGDTVMSDTTQVIIEPGLNVTLNTNSPICENQTLQLNAQPGGMGPGNYSWVSPTGPKPWSSAGVNITPFPNPIPGGWYYVTVTDTNGCTGTDSAFVVSSPIYNIRDTIDICPGDDFTYADGTISTNIQVNENHVSSFTTITFGCDSIIREFLEVKTNCDSLIINPDSSICQGDSITLYADNSSSGYNWIDSLTLNPLGLDSTLTVSPTNSTTYGVYNGTDTVYSRVTVFNSSSFTNILNECEGFNITINGNLYDSTGIYIDTLVGANINGCDSILTTDLTITPNSTGSLTLIECQGFSITINGNTYNSTGVFIDTLINSAANGCDSILTTNLTIIPIVTNNLTLNECSGFTITINGNTYSSSGIYNDTITQGATNGCDSIVNLTLNIIPASTFNQSFTECQGFSITVNGNTYNATGIYIDTLFNASSNGCDSIITTNLTIVQPGNAGLDTSIALCSGDMPIDLYTLLTGADLGGTWSPALTSSTGIFDPQIDPAGMYNYIVTNSPCPADSAVVTVSINPRPTVDITTIDDNCEQSSGAISLSTTSGTPPFTFIWNTGDTDSSIANLGVGTYNVIISDSSGCTNNYSINVEDYQVDCEYHVYLPNVFSPNGDNENDVLYVRGKGIETVKLVIYNRWGNKVFETTDINQGWDGTYRGQEQGSAVFVYYLEATFVNGATAKDKGNVSIVK